MRLSMWGNQDGTGRVTERVLVIDAGGIGAIADPCEPGDVRELAAELLAVAEELERLSDPGNTIQQ
jgi:hypothetical protein